MQRREEKRREEKRKEEKKQEDRRRQKRERGSSQKKEDVGARKGRRITKHCVFPMVWGSRGSKSRLANYQL